MLIYPQLSSGALSQFPSKKRIRLRTVVNRAPDGSAIKASDPPAAMTEWSLTYRDLSDIEVATLQSFFTAAEGRLNSFTFLDPVGNLFSSSDHLDAAVWEKDPLLHLTGGQNDPRGGALGWVVANAGGGGQSLAQTLAVPNGYVYCHSVLVKTAQELAVTLFAGSQRAERKIGPAWSRIAITATPDTPRFGIELPANSTIQVFGMQVEAQPSPSDYQSSSRGGVYEGARFKDDTLKTTATGQNRHSCTVNIIHADHL